MDYKPNRLEEVFFNKAVKHTVPWTYVISNITLQNYCSYEKEFQKANKTAFRIEKSNIVKR